MKILIVEDETAASENLMAMLHELEPENEILGVLESVQQTSRWLQTHHEPDLIMMDIHLSDGSAFSIFNQVTVSCPIIFTTAFDQYALDAFRLNSIDYLLKPVKMADLKRAMDKYHRWTHRDMAEYVERMLRLNNQETTPTYKSSILVPVRDKLVPLPVTEIAFIYSTGRNTQVFQRNGTSYSYNKSLESIISTLDPKMFHRANKQFIVSRETVKELVIWFDSRLLLHLGVEPPEPVYVSKNKAAEFKQWMT